MAEQFAKASAEEILACLPDMYFGTVHVNEKERQVGSNNSWVLDVELSWIVTTAPGVRKSARIYWACWNGNIPMAKQIRKQFEGRQGTVMVWGARNDPYMKNGEEVTKIVCDGMGFALFDHQRIDTLMRASAAGADPALTVPIEPTQETAPAPTAPLVGNRHNGDLAALAVQRPTTPARPPVLPVARPTVPTATARPQVPRPQVPQPPTVR